MEGRSGPSCGYNTGRLTCTKATLAILGEALARRLGRPVVDRTGLTGAYNLLLAWTPDESQVQGTGSGGPSLFSAIQEKLESGSYQGPVGGAGHLGGGEAIGGLSLARNLRYTVARDREGNCGA